MIEHNYDYIHKPGELGELLDVTLYDIIDGADTAVDLTDCTVVVRARYGTAALVLEDACDVDADQTLGGNRGRVTYSFTALTTVIAALTGTKYYDLEFEVTHTPTGAVDYYPKSANRPYGRLYVRNSLA